MAHIILRSGSFSQDLVHSATWPTSQCLPDIPLQLHPELIFDQFSRHLLIQSSWQVKLTILPFIPTWKSRAKGRHRSHVEISITRGQSHKLKFNVDCLRPVASHSDLFLCLCNERDGSRLHKGQPSTLCRPSYSLDTLGGGAHWSSLKFKIPGALAWCIPSLNLSEMSSGTHVCKKSPIWKVHCHPFPT